MSEETGKPAAKPETKKPGVGAWGDLAGYPEYRETQKKTPKS